MKYKFSIEEFMSQIREVDYAILLIGDAYLKSMNCMREVLELRKEVNLSKKMLPVLIGDANIFNPSGRLQYVQYWQEEVSKLEAQLKEIKDATSCLPSYKDLKIIKEIHSNINEFLSDLANKKILKFEEIKDNDYHELQNIWQIYKPSNNVQIPHNNLHLLDQVYNQLQKIYNQFSFYPLQRLKNIYPFTTMGFSFVESYLLHTDNEKLYSLFDIVERLNKGERSDEVSEITKVIKYENKIEFILKKFISNNILYIKDSKSFGFIDLSKLIVEKDKSTCECLKCLYSNFNFTALLIKLKEDVASDDPDNFMRVGFYHYHLGNYNTAKRAFQSALTLFQKSKKNTGKYIAEYNLLAIDRLLNIKSNHNGDWYFDNYEKRQKIIPRKNFQVDGINSELFNWISEGHYMNESLLNLDFALYKIKDHYHLIQSGGYSYNQNLNKFIFTFENAYKFIHYNGLTYTHYTDYKNLTKKYIEGLIISSLIPKEQTGLIGFTSSTLRHIIINSDTKELINLLNRYKLKYLECAEGVASDLVIWLNNLVNSYGELNAAELEEGNQIFFSNRERFFNNLLILFSHVELKNEHIKSIGEALIKLFDKNRFMGFSFHNHLFYLLKNILQRMPKEISIRILKSSYNAGIYHYTNGFSILNNLIANKYQIHKIIKSSDLLKCVKIEKCQICGRIHNLYDVIPLLGLYKNNTRIKNYIKRNLEAKFDINNFYYATLFGLIDFIEYKEIFTELCTESTLKRPISPRPFGYDSEEFSPNQNFLTLISLYIQKGEEIEDKYKKRLKPLSPFYEWILDPNKFDYDNFNVQWLKSFRPSLFQHHYFNQGIIKPYLKNYLMYNKDSALEKLYINYFD